MYSYGPPYMAEQKQDDQVEHTYSSYVRIRDVVLKTSQRRWMIGRSGERGSGISVLAAGHDDDAFVIVYTEYRLFSFLQVETNFFCLYINVYLLTSWAGPLDKELWRITYTHTHTHIYTYIYIYICVCVCVCVLIYILFMDTFWYQNTLYIYIYIYIYIVCISYHLYRISSVFLLGWKQFLLLDLLMLHHNTKQK